MYPSAEHIAVVAFQRVLSAETMIAGQLERDIHRLNGVVGDGDFRQIGLDGGKAQRGGQTSTACSAATRTWLKITSWLPVARIPA